MSPEEEFLVHGRVWLRSALTESETLRLSKLADVDCRPGIRLSMSSELESLIGPQSSLASKLRVFGVDATPVRLVAFNKTDNNNWSVPWHQDRVVAVSEKVDAEGYTNWVPKEGYWHCEPPQSVLDEMIFIRIHIDENSDENGSMELALGSHREGKIASREIEKIVSDCDIEVCNANAGDVLIVHALTLHRSKSARFPSMRRALRVDYARRELLAPELQWAIAL